MSSSIDFYVQIKRSSERFFFVHVFDCAEIFIENSMHFQRGDAPLNRLTQAFAACLIPAADFSACVMLHKNE
jgi:hypothetical protein